MLNILTGYTQSISSGKGGAVMANNGNKGSGQSVIPGMEEFVKGPDEEFFFSGEKKETYFDAASLPDSPGRQNNAHGHTTYVMYVLFPSQEEMLEALSIFTNGYRKSLKAGDKIGSLNAVAKLPKDPEGRTFLEYWREEYAGKKRKKRHHDEEDEAQAPV